jgi:hypothetical protein
MTIPPLKQAEIANNKHIYECLVDMREHMVKLDERIKTIQDAVADLKADRNRVVWGVLTFVGAVIGGIVLWALNKGAHITGS